MFIWAGQRKTVCDEEYINGDSIYQMKLLRGIREDMRCGMYGPIILISMIGIVISCLFANVYESTNGTQYTILKLLFYKDRKVAMERYGMTPYDYWVEGIGLWTKILMPFFIGMAECLISSQRKKSRMDRWMSLRQGKRIFSVCRCTGAFIRSGIIMVTAYLVFGSIVYLFFGPEMIIPDAMKIISRTVGAFFYGAYIGAIVLFCCTLFSDKYILMCFPLLIKYMYDKVLDRFLAKAVSSRDQGRIDFVYGFGLERIVDLNETSGFWVRLGCLIALYFIIGSIIYIMLRKGEKNVRIE